MTKYPYMVTSFYKFQTIDDLYEMQLKLQKLTYNTPVKGTLLIAKEGINGSLSGTKEDICNIKLFISELFPAMIYNSIPSPIVAFKKMKVKVRKEIVVLKWGKFDPENRPGTLSPEKWHQFIQKEDTSIIDIRNDYEVILGSFKNSINPKTRHFSQFKEWAKRNLKGKDKESNIAIFCTGGIRCEKGGAYIKSLGFKNVFQLQGGILNYLNEVPKKKEAWEGDCFVFDDRVLVNHDLTPSNNSL